MNRALRTLALPTALATVLALAACGSSTDSTTSPGPGGHSRTSMPTMTGRTSTPNGTGSATAAGQHNDADVRFSTDMIPHHRQAILMSTMAASRANTAQVKKLAAQIKAAQTPEIRTMSGWLEGWGVPVPGTMGSMSMGSTGGMSPREMTALGRATGPSFDLDVPDRHGQAPPGRPGHGQDRAHPGSQSRRQEARPEHHRLPGQGDRPDEAHARPDAGLRAPRHAPLEPHGWSACAGGPPSPAGDGGPPGATATAGVSVPTAPKGSAIRQRSAQRGKSEGMTNRLASATSPYLLQHADNPVDWWEWGEEAFAEARRRDVPVLLSVGYAACHWCHVMAHESFEDDERRRGAQRALRRDQGRPRGAARTSTRSTWPRPRRMTGQGGWPMTCLLTPDGEPFFAGTYFPQRRSSCSCSPAVDRGLDRAPRRGARQRQPDVAEQLRAAAQTGAPAAIGDDVAGRGGRRGWPASSTAPRRLRRRAEVPAVDGAGVPAAPPRPHRRRPRAADGRRAPARRWPAAACTTSSAGGFARYSRRRRLGGAALREDALRQRPAAARLPAPGGGPPARRWPSGSPARPPTSCCATCAPPEGGFASALDADTDGVEGLTYVWTPAPADRGARARTTAPAPPRCSSVTAAGTFEHGTSTLQLRDDPADAALVAADPRAGCWRARSRAPAAGPRRQGRHRLERPGHRRARRGRRPAGASPTTSTPPRECAGSCSTAHVVDGRLRRSSRDGVVGAAHGGGRRTTATSPRGCWRCTRRPAAPRWLGDGGAAARAWRSSTSPTASGGFYDTADDAEALFTPPARTRPTTPTPAGSSALAGALLTYAALTGSARHREAAEAALASAGCPGGPATRASPGGRSPSPRRPRPARCRWPSSATTTGPTPCWPWRAGRPPPGWCSRPATPTPRACRCSPSARWCGTLRGLRLPGLRVRPAGHRARPAGGGAGLTAWAVTGGRRPVSLAARERQTIGADGLSRCAGAGPGQRYSRMARYPGCSTADAFRARAAPRTGRWPRRRPTSGPGPTTLTEPSPDTGRPVAGSTRWSPLAAVPEVATAPADSLTTSAIRDRSRGSSMPIRQRPVAVLGVPTADDQTSPPALMQNARPSTPRGPPRRGRRPSP